MMCNLRHSMRLRHPLWSRCVANVLQVCCKCFASVLQHRHMHTHPQTYTHTHTHTNIQTCAWVHTCTHTHTHIHTDVYIYICLCMYMGVFVNVLACMNSVLIDEYVVDNTRKHTHTYKNARAFSLAHSTPCPRTKHCAATHVHKSVAAVVPIQFKWIHIYLSSIDLWSAGIYNVCTQWHYSVDT